MEEFHSLKINQQFTYSILSSIVSPILFISLVLSDPIYSVTERSILPIDPIFYMFISEIIKVLFSIWLYPTTDNPYSTYYYSGSMGIIGFNEFDRKSNTFRLPTIRESSSGKNRANKTRPILKVYDITLGMIGFLISIVICHLIIILLGAPFVQDWILTAQFSFIMVSWIFLPLCLNFKFSSILSEIFYISIWDDSSQYLFLSKCRFLLTCFGGWIGAVAFPLDWDRPWQKWPIPCLFSAFAGHILVNFAIMTYLIYKEYRETLRRYLFPHRQSKVKIL